MRISDWSSDVCSYDLRAISDLKPAKPARKPRNPAPETACSRDFGVKQAVLTQFKRKNPAWRRVYAQRQRAGIHRPSICGPAAQRLLAPLRRGQAHAGLEGALEGGLGLEIGSAHV